MISLTNDEEKEMIKDQEIAKMIANTADFDLLPDDNDINAFDFNVRVDADYDN
jgi:hypothetical protein